MAEQNKGQQTVVEPQNGKKDTIVVDRNELGALMAALDQQKAQIEELQKQIAEATKPVAPATDPLTALLTAFANASGTVKKGRAPQPAQHVLDTKTGIAYYAKNKAGLAVAKEYGLPTVLEDGKPNTFVWYTVIQKDDKRFKLMTQAEFDAHPANKKVDKGA